MITDLLRTELGFTGLAITDALNMKALTLHYSAEEIALKALQAGRADLGSRTAPAAPAATINP